MVQNRLARLERALGVLGGGACPTCRGGAYPFIVHRWILTGGGHRDEAEANDVYDGQGACRACGCACSDVLILVLPERVMIVLGGDV